MLKTYFKKFAVSVMFGCGLPAAFGQGIPTFDAASLAQAVQQVAAWQQQYQQMTQQINQLTAQINAVTGARNLGSILQNPTIQASLPPEYQDISRLISSGSLTASAATLNQIRTAYGVDLTNSPNALQNEAQTLSNAQAKATSWAAQSAQITELAAKVDELTDLKDSSDMVNRNLIEVQRLLLQQIQRSDVAEAKAAADRIREAAAKQAHIKTVVQSLKMAAVQ